MVLLPDTNVWLALTLKGHIHHGSAISWFRGVGKGSSVAFCRSTQQSLLRLLTTDAVIRAYNRPPLTNDQAWEVQSKWAMVGCVSFLDEPAGIGKFWKAFACRKQASPKLWMDAYLAAFAKAGASKLVTTDKAFKHFDELDLLVLGD